MEFPRLRSPTVPAADPTTRSGLLIFMLHPCSCDTRIEFVVPMHVRTCDRLCMVLRALPVLSTNALLKPRSWVLGGSGVSRYMVDHPNMQNGVMVVTNGHTSSRLPSRHAFAIDFISSPTSAMRAPSLGNSSRYHPLAMLPTSNKKVNQAASNP